MFKKIDLSERRWQWILFFGLAIIWGSSFILMKKGLRSYTDIQVATLRITISFLIFLPSIIKRVKQINFAQAKSLAVVGIIGNAIPAFLFTKAQTHINSSLAGILNSIVPFFVLIVGFLFYKATTKWHNVLGISLGFAGAAGLIFGGVKGGNLMQGDNWYALLIVMASVCYAFSLNEVKHKLQELSGVTITALAFMFTGPFAIFLLLFSNFGEALTNDIVQNEFPNVFYITILAMVNSVIAVIVFNLLIKHTTALFAASVTYIIPIFAIFWGFFDGEILVISDIIWGSIILTGVYLVNKKERVLLFEKLKIIKKANKFKI